MDYRVSLIFCLTAFSSVVEVHEPLKTCSQVFSLNWRLARSALATEGLPFLRLIKIIDEQRRMLSSKRRYAHTTSYCF